MTEHEASRRAITWIRDRLGSVGDLSPEVVSVVWVTVYRCMELGIDVERRGGRVGLMFNKDGTFGISDLMIRSKKSIGKIEFLQKMVSIIRNTSQRADIINIEQLLVDCLKWDIIDAAEMSDIDRKFARESAIADSLYSNSVPDEIYT